MLVDSHLVTLDDDGYLKIDFRPMFEMYCLRIHPWSKGFAIDSWQDAGWAKTHSDPGLPLISIGAVSPDNPVREFIQTIPQSILDNVKRFHHNQITMLHWLATYPYAETLLHNNPILLWLLTYVARCRGWNSTQIDQILKAKQKEQLRIVLNSDFLPSIRFIRKISIDNGDLQELNLIRWALRSPQLYERLKHLPIIPTGLISLLQRFPYLLNSSLYLEFTSPVFIHLTKIDTKDLGHAFSRAAEYFGIWKDSIRLGRDLELIDADHSMTQCETFKQIQDIHDRWPSALNKRHAALSRSASFKQLQNLHDRWTAALNKRHSENMRENITPYDSIDSIESTIIPYDYPPPPIPGNEHIEPIRRVTELHNEGWTMQHCIASYADDVAANRYYIYRVLKPERATLALDLTTNPPQVLECRLGYNRLPSAATMVMVHDWLETFLQGKSLRTDG